MIDNVAPTPVLAAGRGHRNPTQPGARPNGSLRPRAAPAAHPDPLRLIRHRVALQGLEPKGGLLEAVEARRGGFRSHQSPTYSQPAATPGAGSRPRPRL